MALQHSISLPSGIEVATAYTRIVAATYTKDSLIVTIETHANEQARLDGKPALLSQSYMIAWQDTVGMTYVYNQLKLFPDFADAEDC